MLALTFVLFVACGSGSSASGSVAQDPEECGLDHDHSLPMLEPCLEQGEQFIHSYYKKLLRGKEHADKCSVYSAFRECVREAEARCPHQVTLLLQDSHWTDVIRTMDCHCDVHSPPSWLTQQGGACTDSLECVEEELSGLFAQRCEDYHRFNGKQHTHHRCHFRQHELQCKERLVRSACGTSAGAFSTALSQIYARKHNGCHLTPPRHNNEFGYSDQCPRNLTSYIEQCATRAFSERRANLRFLEQNSLIADHKKKNVKLACGRYKVYRQCIEPLEQTCMQGISHLLDMQQETHVYMLKMKYICVDAQDAYYDNLACYKRTQNNGTLAQCLPIWTDTLRLLQNLTAVDFYCNRSDTTRETVLSKLEELRDCYESRFTAFCGDTAGTTMGAFIRTVITDPFYLGYTFQPDCSLHVDTPTTGATTTTAISPTKRPDSNTKKKKEDAAESKGKAAQVSSGAASSGGAVYSSSNAGIVLLLLYSTTTALVVLKSGASRVIL